MAPLGLLCEFGIVANSLEALRRVEPVNPWVSSLEARHILYGWMARRPAAERSLNFEDRFSAPPETALTPYRSIGQQLLGGSLSFTPLSPWAQGRETDGRSPETAAAVQENESRLVGNQYAREI